MKQKIATMKIYYKNGSFLVKYWKLNMFTEDSNVIGNLRSREEFRQGEWQKKKIIEVVVTVKID